MAARSASKGEPCLLWVPLEPTPASRPIVSRYGTRYGKNHMIFQKEFRTWAQDLPASVIYPKDVLVAVTLDFVSTKARTSKLQTPRYDIDNACKLIMDCLTDTKYLWDDDKQVVELHATKRFMEKGEEPHIRVETRRA